MKNVYPDEKIKIGIVEDHELFRTSLKIALSRSQHLRIIWTCSDGETCVELCNSEFPDLILMDIGVPTLNGIEVSKMIKDANSKVKIIMSLTSPVCPYGPQLIEDVRRNAAAVDGVKEVEVEITFSPPWGPEKLSEEARIALGM